VASLCSFPVCLAWAYASFLTCSTVCSCHHRDVQCHRPSTCSVWDQDIRRPGISSGQQSPVLPSWPKTGCLSGLPQSISQAIMPGNPLPLIAAADACSPRASLWREQAGHWPAEKKTGTPSLYLTEATNSFGFMCNPSLGEGITFSQSPEWGRPKKASLAVYLTSPSPYMYLDRSWRFVRLIFRLTAFWETPMRESREASSPILAPK